MSRLAFLGVWAGAVHAPLLVNNVEEAGAAGVRTVIGIVIATGIVTVTAQGMTKVK